MFTKLGQAAEYIQSIRKIDPQVGLVLGSGLGIYLDHIEDKTIIPYSDIPHFLPTTIEGHPGRLILGKVGDFSVAVLQGRLHAYEGHSMEQIVFPVRTLATLGIEFLFLTNAAGGINLDFKPGDIVLINDHINFMGQNPLIGPNIQELGPRFPDMTNAYHPRLKELVAETAQKLDIELKSGVYASVLGPTYETPSEIKMLRTLGADMVGMSTVPESISANHLGLNVCGLSCVTNLGAGMKNEKLSHEDVKKEAKKVMDEFSTLLTETIKCLDRFKV